MGYAEQHMHRGNGYIIWLDWYRQTYIWQLRKPHQRAIITELYECLRWEDGRDQKYQNLEPRRGEVVLTLEGLTRDAGCGHGNAHFARQTITALVNDGIVSSRRITGYDDQQTQQLTRVTWNDFDAYREPAKWIPRRGKGLPSKYHTTDWCSVRRWWRRSPVWQVATAAELAVIDTLYFSIRRTETRLDDLRIAPSQCLTSIGRLALNTNCKHNDPAISAAIDRLTQNGIISIDYPETEQEGRLTLEVDASLLAQGRGLNHLVGLHFTQRHMSPSSS